MIAIKVVGDDGTKIVTEPHGHLIARLMSGSWRPRPSDTLAHMTGFDSMRIRRACDDANDCEPVDDGEALAEVLTMVLSGVECIPPVVRWTTAEQAYDYGRTIELEGGIQSFGMAPSPGRTPRTWRKVAMHPKDVDMQEGRYGSGSHPSLTEDPREIERRETESLEKWRAQMAEQKAGEAEVAKWLVEAPLSELEAEFERDEGLRKYLKHDVLRTAIKTRQDEADKKSNKAKYAEFIKKMPKDGIIIADVYSYDRYGSRPPWKSGEVIHYGLKVSAFWGQSLENVSVNPSDPRTGWSLERFVGYLEDGSFRAVNAEDVPPEAVMKKFGYDRIKAVHKFEDSSGKAVWVARNKFDVGETVLDEKGHKVRTKALIQSAIEYLWTLER